MFWSGSDLFDKKCDCAGKCHEEIGEEFAESVKVFSGNKVIFGSGSARIWDADA